MDSASLQPPPATISRCRGTDFARLSTENRTLDANEVAQVEQAFEHHVVHIFVLFGTDVIAGDVYLDATFGVLQFNERCLSHHTAAHDASGDRHLARLGVILELVADVGGKGIGYILSCGIGVDAHVAQFGQTLTSDNLLFTQL